MSGVNSEARSEAESDLSPQAFGAAENDTETPPVQQAGDGDGEGEGQAQQQEQQGEEQQQQEQQPSPYDQAPEFWSAERKALWERITDPDLRQALHEIDQERVTATSKKIEEAALERKTASEKLQTFEQERDQLAAWWKDTGPKIAAAFQSKWARIDWNQLSAENPAEWARLRQEYDNDAALIRQATEKHQDEIRKADQRAAGALQESKRAEHDKLAKAYPDHFGKPDVAQKTYDELGDYLAKQGVPADRIPNIYESYVVGVALKAMLYDRAQAAAKAAKGQQQQDTAQQTPRRIPPGASTKGQPNQGNDYRQARERLNNGEPLSEKDAALLFA